MAERFGAAFFRAVPEEPGVYLMSTQRDGVIYVGKARNLRRRLGSYRSGTADRYSRKLARLLRQVERIDWDLCPTEEAALARERDLIRTLQPRFNTMGVRPPREWFIRWERWPGRVHLSLEPSSDHVSPTHPPESSVASAAIDGSVHGPFVFARPAFTALLRSLWQRLHPNRSITELPSPLLAREGPMRWRVPRSIITDHWLEQLDSYLTGQFSSLRPLPDVSETTPLTPTTKTELASTDPSVLATESPGLAKSTELAGLSFADQWRALDAECLAEFHDRLRQTLIPPEVGLLSPSTNS